jgi:hypothetical protein
MRTVLTEVYAFSELSEKAKENARQWLISDWDLCLHEDDYYQDLLSVNGFKNAKIEYSISYSQGDGASFTADIDLDKFLVGKYEALKGVDFELKIHSFDSNYCHERTKQVEAHFYHGTEAEGELIDELRKEVEELRIDLCKTIYEAMVSDYESQTSVESVNEFAENNGYEFTREGDFYRGVAE